MVSVADRTSGLSAVNDSVFPLFRVIRALATSRSVWTRTRTLVPAGA